MHISVFAFRLGISFVILSQFIKRFPIYNASVYECHLNTVCQRSWAVTVFLFPTLFFLGLFIQQASQNGNSFELILDPQIPELGIASDSAPESRANKHKSPENTHIYKPKASGS